MVCLPFLDYRIFPSYDTVLGVTWFLIYCVRYTYSIASRFKDEGKER